MLISIAFESKHKEVHRHEWHIASDLWLAYGVALVFSTYNFAIIMAKEAKLIEGGSFY